MRVTVDTNLIVSAALWGGTPRRVVDSARDGFFELCTSPALLVELKSILGRAKFDKQFLSVGFTREDLINEFLGFAIFVDAAQLRSGVSRDPDDDAVLACALASESEIIVSGDNDLLDLVAYKGIRILSANEFLSEFDL